VDDVSRGMTGYSMGDEGGVGSLFSASTGGEAGVYGVKIEICQVLLSLIKQ